MSGEITVGSHQFMVILGQMEDAIGTLDYQRSRLEAARDHIKKHFDNATQTWDSPAADGFRNMLPTVEGNMNDLLSALDTIQDRLRATHQNYLAAEQANRNSLTPPAAGPKVIRAAGPGPGASSKDGHGRQSV